MNGLEILHNHRIGCTVVLHQVMMIVALTAESPFLAPEVMLLSQSLMLWIETTDVTLATGQ